MTIQYVMKTNILFFILLVIGLAIVSSSCKSLKSVTTINTDTTQESVKMSMTFSKSGNVVIAFAGSGMATIDWGDGTPTETHTLSYNNVEYSHNYSGKSPRIITISGEKITYLSCSGLGLTSLDVSRNIALGFLYCADNLLTNLDVSKNIALKILRCGNNQLTNLDVSNNTALTKLWCYDNQLTSLDVSRNTELILLSCANNSLKSLDISKNIALMELYCSDNQLTSLDVNNNIALTKLYCGNNPLTTLDTSNNTKLEKLYCVGNQLSAAALNALFETMHSNTISGVTKTISIMDNLGTDSCNQSIATNKGWIIGTEY